MPQQAAVAVLLDLSLRKVTCISAEQLWVDPSAWPGTLLTTIMLNIHSNSFFSC